MWKQLLEKWSDEEVQIATRGTAKDIAWGIEANLKRILKYEKLIWAN